MKFAEYAVWILIHKVRKFGSNSYYHCWYTEVFLGDCFYCRTLYLAEGIALPQTLVNNNNLPYHRGVPGQVLSESADCHMYIPHRRNTCSGEVFGRRCEFYNHRHLPSSRPRQSCAQLLHIHPLQIVAAEIRLFMFTSLGSEWECQWQWYLIAQYHRHNTNSATISDAITLY